MNVIFHDEALEEMLESARYYEERLKGLGWDFLTAVEQTIQRISASPEAGSIHRRDIRKRLIRGFPFTVLYSVKPDHIFVVAVMHQRRKPAYWIKRLSS